MMTKSSAEILLASLGLIVYYGTALFCLVWDFWLLAPAWMESLLYAVSLTEPAAWMIRLAMLPFLRAGSNVEEVAFAFYLVMMLTVSFLLLLRKSWARKAILISQALRICFLVVYAALSLAVLASAHMTPSLRLMNFGIIAGGFFALLLPSLAAWYVLMKPSVKSEFSA